MTLSSSSSESEIDWLGLDQNEEIGDGVEDYGNISDTESLPGTSKTSQQIRKHKHTIEESKNTHQGVKKKKWDVKFNKVWKEKYDWIFEGNLNTEAQCRACRCQFSIKHGGENDIVKHLRTEKHTQNVNATSKTKSVNRYFSSMADKDSIALAECAFVFHAIKYAQRYASADCAGKLFPLIFKDSKTAEKYSCGRTKATKIVTKILGPESKNIIKKDLANDNPFSLATDASNKGNIKTFPLIVKYFQTEKGVSTKLLKFYSNSSEKSVDIAKCLIDGLDEAGLSIKNVTAYCADNASVNFGKKQSVMTELHKHNKNILPFDCVCHIIHNAGKYGQNVIRYDIETIVIKCYNEFSSSSKKLQSLKICMSFVNKNGQSYYVLFLHVGSH
ncbi:uncharacterized protein LOC126749099 [Anthonomus grandis grandis]|uniref:uncharacterized protein LOC126749099 n=1 Tax=Anthonomus grandis grandis TaxID=2921223 RepID=UPI0021662962|nr:uncharacterized protein LOC126749099 [Anthonomus grandis grandis]XP_050314690.1 uncharacterized protein LOC126749099 [Anthonomus grandis grandis]